MDMYNREMYMHLSNLEWDALGRKSASVGSDAIEAMLGHMSSDAQHASIARFIQNELNIAQHHIAEMARQSQAMGNRTKEGPTSTP